MLLRLRALDRASTSLPTLGPLRPTRSRNSNRRSGADRPKSGSFGCVGSESWEMDEGTIEVGKVEFMVADR
jgi:hypothetical protein